MTGRSTHCLVVGAAQVISTRQSLWRGRFCYSEEIFRADCACGTENCISLLFRRTNATERCVAALASIWHMHFGIAHRFIDIDNR